MAVQAAWRRGVGVLGARESMAAALETVEESTKRTDVGLPCVSPTSVAVACISCKARSKQRQIRSKSNPATMERKA